MKINYRTNHINYDPGFAGIANMIEVEYQIDGHNIEKFALDSELVFENQIHKSVLYDAYSKYPELFTHSDSHGYKHITGLNNGWEAAIRFPSEPLAAITRSMIRGANRRSV